MTSKASSTDTIRWIDRDRRRYDRDQVEVHAAFPELGWVEDAAGGWNGILPLWPFDRPSPNAIADAIGLNGLRMEMRYPQAYPMVPPSIRPLDPEPDLVEWTVHGWHVNGDGTLCLLRSSALWDPRSSVVELLLKAAGWRIEYSLMKHEVIDAMTESGIVSDGSLDDLIEALGQKVRRNINLK